MTQNIMQRYVIVVTLPGVLGDRFEDDPEDQSDDHDNVVGLDDVTTLLTILTPSHGSDGLDDDHNTLEGLDEDDDLNSSGSFLAKTTSPPQHTQVQQRIAPTEASL